MDAKILNRVISAFVSVANNFTRLPDVPFPSGGWAIIRTFDKQELYFIQLGNIACSNDKILCESLRTICELMKTEYESGIFIPNKPEEYRGYVTAYFETQKFAVHISNFSAQGDQAIALVGLYLVGIIEEERMRIEARLGGNPTVDKLLRKCQSILQ